MKKPEKAISTSVFDISARDIAGLIVGAVVAYLTIVL